MCWQSHFNLWISQSFCRHIVGIFNSICPWVKAMEMYCEFHYFNPKYLANQKKRVFNSHFINWMLNVIWIRFVCILKRNIKIGIFLVSWIHHKSDQFSRLLKPNKCLLIINNWLICLKRWKSVRARIIFIHVHEIKQASI